MEWYLYTKNQLELELKTNFEKGLEEVEAKKRLAQFGLNILPDQKPDSWLILFFRQFQSPLVYLLLLCSVGVFYLQEYADGAIILSVLFINAIIGVIQEGKSARVLDSLKKLSQPEVTVLRDGKEVILPEKELVFGDVLMLFEGQKVGADARVIFHHNLGVDESALTGESGAVVKNDHAGSGEVLPLTSQHNMVFKGTNVLSGNGRAVVVATGLATELGKISKTLLIPREEIPMQKNIRKLSEWILYFIAGMCVVLFLLGIHNGKTFTEMFTLIVSLTVSVIPEGLPLVLTVILVTGAFRMSKKNALVKKLQSVEALGQASVLAIDKTGTLTFNQMIVKKVLIGKNIYKISGNGYEPKGQAFFEEKLETNNTDLQMSAKVASLASSAEVLFSEELNNYKIAGDPTEASISVFGEKLGIPKSQLLKVFTEVSEKPFDYKSKYRSVVYEHAGQNFCVYVGAPEALLKLSSHFLELGVHKQNTAQQTQYIEDAIENFSSEGLRVVAFGFKHLPKNFSVEDMSGIVFAGIFAIEDALRPEAKSAVVSAKSAGLKVVMITGDLKNTAVAIAKEAEIFKTTDLVLSGLEIETMNDLELSEKILKTSVFFRVTPESKMKIIRAYKNVGLVVAMTGDGVNDAPSLLAADLGVAMGKVGTEVAKSAADIVLLDDNLFSIVAAIKEGRIMYQNIKKTLAFMFSTSMGELLTISFALFLKLPLPVIAIQILWMNLVTDPLLGAALALEKGEQNLNKENPERFSKYFVDKIMLVHILLVACLMAGATLFFFEENYSLNPSFARTFSLTLLAVFQWYNALNCRFLEKSLFNKRLFSNMYVWLALFVNIILQLLAVYNPWLNKILHTSPLSFADWVVILALGFTVILVDEFRKFFVRRFVIN